MKLTTYEDLTQAEITNQWGRHSMTVSVYLIDGMMIDTGPAKKKNEMYQLFHEWNPSQVVLTHHHEDHTGMASWAQKQMGIPIFIHELGVNRCTEVMKLPLYRRVFWGERPPFQPARIGQTHESLTNTWEVIHTPGHAEDHIALFNKKKGWMIGGDLYVQPKPKSAFAFESFPVMAESLRKVLRYDFDTYVCSHAGVLPKGRQAIQKKLDYLESVIAEVQHHKGLGLTPREIHKKMFPKRHPMHLLSFFENSPRHIVNSVLTK